MISFWPWEEGFGGVARVGTRCRRLGLSLGRDWPCARAVSKLQRRRLLASSFLSAHSPHPKTSPVHSAAHSNCPQFHSTIAVSKFDRKIRRITRPVALDSTHRGRLPSSLRAPAAGSHRRRHGCKHEQLVKCRRCTLPRRQEDWVRHGNLLEACQPLLTPGQ